MKPLQPGPDTLTHSPEASRGSWLRVADLVATRLPKEYDQAVCLLLDLRDLAARSDPAAFQSQLDRFRTAQARKPSLIARLKDAGL